MPFDDLLDYVLGRGGRVACTSFWRDLAGTWTRAQIESAIVEWQELGVLELTDGVLQEVGG